MCRACGFSLEVLDRALGVPPSLSTPVSDIPRRLGSGMRGIERAISRLEKSYPQISVAVVVTSVPPQVSASIYTFWLFNRAQLSSPSETAGNNRMILLLMDADSPRVVAMAGYGLEPLLPESALQACLQAATQQAAQGLAAYAECFVMKLHEQLDSVHQMLERQFGLQQAVSWQPVAEVPRLTPSAPSF
jgi:uncharacterized membrane protein YgcG